MKPTYSLRLADYPYILARLICRDCERRGNFRLAHLAARYGSEVTIYDVLKILAGDCPRWDGKRILIGDFCEAYFPDLGEDDPPGLPPKQLLLRVVK